MTQEQAMSTTPGRDTVLFLAGRPGTFGVRHNHLYQQLGLDFYYRPCAPTTSRPR